MSDLDREAAEAANSVAILAMAGRFPGAATLDAFWANLRDGVESIRILTAEELAASGVTPEAYGNPSYVPACGTLAGVDLFDAPFFGLSAREAALLDPQQRLFLECSWEAMEAAGYDVSRLDRPVGVFAGESTNSYYFYYLYSAHDLLNDPAAGQLYLGNDKDFLATRISYKLGLRGPSMSVQTACSTSLVAVHLACQSLLNGECDMALAGGVSVRVPQAVGYFYQPGGILAPDGHIRAFDAGAGGSVSGSGVGVVVLKRLEDARADGDPIRAVIRGSAVNNDGALRVGFTAPSVEGQSAAVAEALALARVDPATVGYVEAHGSGTPLGDPIEIAALTRAFSSETAVSGRRGYCAVGSVKTNIGHLDAAAGAAGLIKTVLALENRAIPPSLNFRSPNPEIDFAGSPFFVNTVLRPWETPEDDLPRRAGVSSFGMGGTNAHVVLEEAPAVGPAGSARPAEILVLSAATPEALDRATANLAGFLARADGHSLADIAFTLQVGRRAFPHRRALVVPGGDAGLAEARRILAERDPTRLLEWQEERTDRGVAFLLPGVGEHYAGMARRLYEAEPVFRRELDAGLELLSPRLGLDLKALLFPPAEEAGPAASGKLDLKALLGRGAEAAPSPSPLARTAVAQPLLFAVEVALGRQLEAWGVAPRALAGYSLGEYSAACLAGVFSLADGARLVAERARLIEELPAGAMLALPLPEGAATDLLGDELSLSAVNGSALSVVGGPPEAVAALEARLAAQGVASRRLQTSHAFHTRMMGPIAERFGEFVAGVALADPSVPLVSNVTGTWVAAGEMTDPAYWVRHLLEPVRFGAGLEALTGETQLLLEVGPGQSLSSLALQDREGIVAVPSLPSQYERRDDLEFALTALARLWMAGAGIDWAAFHQPAARRRVALPTYPFERRRHWIEKRATAPANPMASTATVSDEPAAEAIPAGVATTVQARPGLPNPYAAPTDPTETALVEIWQDLLGVAPIGIHDSFFDLGGHSLLAAQLAARIKARFGVDLALQVFFEAPTVAGLALRVGEGEAGAAAEPIPPRPRRDRAPMSFAQQRLWFVEQLAPGNAAYNNPMAVRLSGPLSPAALDAALAEIARRHEILRTTFGREREEGGEPVQRIAPFDREALPPLTIMDLAGLPEAARQAASSALVGGIVRRPFDLENGPVRRAALLRLSTGEHLFVTAMHHILWDEWSQGIFVSELAALYEAFHAGRPSPLPPLPLQFGDFALWQRQSLSSGVLKGHLDYFTERLAGAPRLLALPTDRPRPAMQTYRGGTVPFAAPPELHRRLAALAQERGATLFMLLLAAFVAVLSRYSGQDDLVVSTGVGGRPRVEAESLIGCFINILLLRGDLSDRPGFGRLLERTAAATLADFAHQDLPFEALIDTLKVERDPSYTPLAQVMLVFLNVPQVSIRLSELEVAGVRVDRKAAQFDLTLYLGEQGGTLSGHLEHNADLFDGATAARLLSHFTSFLARAVEDPDLPISEVPLLSEAERWQAVFGWNDTAEPFPDRPLHSLFEEQAARQPEAPALFCGGETLSYRDLDLRANRLARHLAVRGVRPGATVGVSLRHGPEVAVALLAILKAGGAYVPLDPNYPQERLAYMLEAAEVSTLVTSAKLAGRFDRPGLVRVLIDAEAEAIAAGPLESPGIAVTPDDRVYVIFTSGSTGNPKGCILDHRGRVNNFTDFNRHYSIGAGDRVLALSSLSFDMSAYDLLGTFAGGGAVVLPRPEDVLEPARWVALAEEHRPTVWHSVPALLEMFLDALGGRDPGEGALADLRLVLLGGDWIPVGLPDRLRAAVPGAHVVSLGGATEVSMDSIVYDVGEVDPAWKSIPYGRPMANQLAYVVGPAPEPCPVGVPGELYLGGVGVGQGYFGRPDLTAERFLPDPFAARPGGRIYRTGDLARYGADGVIELLGRMDHQVKIRGYRIELGEILAAVRAVPGVLEAVVVARDDDNSGVKRLVAYVVPEEGVGEIPGLAEALAARLPAYMMPSAFVRLAALPLTPNGKLDRKALPAPEAAAGREAVPPRTPLEKVLARIWADVLSRPLEGVGAADSFFDLGGHSLSATRVVTQVEEAFPFAVPLRTLFEAPTLEGFAGRLEALARAAEVDLPGIAEVLLEIGEMSEDDVAAELAVPLPAEGGRAA